MDSKSTRDVFQYVLLGIFVLLAGLSVVYISTYKPKSDIFIDTTPLVIWGPVFGSDNTMSDALKEIAGHDESLKTVTYVVKNPLTMYADLVEAVAEGHAPDLLLFDGSALLELRTQLLPISYQSLSLRQYRDTYVEGAEIFALTDNIYALPLLVDPLVLYWNRDLFTNSLVTQVPADWDTFVQVAPRLSSIEQGADLKQAGVAFGEYDNVMHAREILSALLMQTGDPIVNYNGKVYKSVMKDPTTVGSDPTLALEFYTDFSNPRKTVYSWNKTFDRSREAFAANKVAMYGGFASEALVLASINPNLNFDVALWPQSARSNTKVTYGKFYGLAVVKNSAHVNKAISVLQTFTAPEATKVWSKYAHIPSTRRSMLGGIPTDPFAEVLARSAIISRSWLAPHIGGPVDDIFSQLVNDITTGKELPNIAMRRASDGLQLLLDRYNEK
jgi:ABC-type glycerol-3-phosphate transport system substrate-binding protein